MKLPALGLELDNDGFYELVEMTKDGKYKHDCPFYDSRDLVITDVFFSQLMKHRRLKEDNVHN